MRLLVASLPTTPPRNTISPTASSPTSYWPKTLAVITCMLIASALLSSALGQTIEFAVDHPAPEAADPRFELLFQDVPRDGGKVGLRLAAGDGLELGLRLRQAGSVATVGNIVSVLAADASSNGRFAVASTTRGVLGPAAVRIRASVSDGGVALAPIAEGAFGPLPLLNGGTLLGLEAGLDYRVSRRLIVGATPGMFLLDGEIGGRFDGEARFVRAVSGNDLTLLLHSFAEPGSGRFTASVGMGYTINRRRAPSWTAAALLGWGPDGPLPGLRVSGSERLEEGNFDLSLSLEPYRLDQWPYRIEAGYRHDLTHGELRATVLAGLQPESGWRAGGRVGYRIPFTP